jgi:hypothetical protein
MGCITWGAVSAHVQRAIFSAPRNPQPLRTVVKDLFETRDHYCPFHFDPAMLRADAEEHRAHLARSRPRKNMTAMVAFLRASDRRPYCWRRPVPNSGPTGGHIVL